MPEAVATAEYPQLRSICWNTEESPVLDPKVTSGESELHWSFVDQTSLTARVRALIRVLADAFGMGLINA